MARTSDIVKGLQILDLYANQNSHLSGAEHDVVIGPSTVRSISDEDRKRLESLGWKCDFDADAGYESAWFHYV